MSGKTTQRRILCRFDEVADGGSRGFELDAARPLSLFVVRQDDRLYAYRNSCPHTGVQLNWQYDRFLNFDGSLIRVYAESCG